MLLTVSLFIASIAFSASQDDFLDYGIPAGSKKVKAKSLEQCYAKCDDMDDCRSAAFVETGPKGGDCYLLLDGQEPEKKKKKTIETETCKKADDKDEKIQQAVINGQQYIFIHDAPAVIGDPHFASRTLPDGLEIKLSDMPNAGLAVFATETLGSNYIYGPYRGKRYKHSEKDARMGNSYTWQVGEKNEEEWIDGSDETISNWMRFVNHPLDRRKQNLKPMVINKQMYYLAMREIAKGEELLVWYGEGYHQDLLKATKIAAESNGANLQCEDVEIIRRSP